MTGKNSKSKKSNSSAMKSGHERAVTCVPPQKENVADSAPTEKLPEDTFKDDENGGLEQVGPPLTSGNVEFGFYGEDSVEQGNSSKPVRLKEPKKRLDELEVRVEKALRAKRQQNWYFRELRKRRNCVQELILSHSTPISGVESEIYRYEEAFRNFVSSHDNYFSFEDDEEKKQFIVNSYQNEREIKLQLEILTDQWRKRGVTPPTPLRVWIEP